jgi:hypothetical protein
LKTLPDPLAQAQRAALADEKQLFMLHNHATGNGLASYQFLLFSSSGTFGIDLILKTLH